MNTRILKITVITIIALLTTFLIGRWAVSSYQAAQIGSPATAIKVVASTNVWGDIASQVGGRHVQVTSVLSDPEADPHLFESDAKTASQVAEAQLVITNGLGYDEFMDKLLGASGKEQNVLTVADILKSNSDANPHLWYDLPHIPEVATAIQDELIRLDPEHTADYQRNTKQFINDLQPTISKLTQRNQPVAYTERVAGYLIEDLGLVDKTPTGFSQSVESGSEPSPQQIQEFEAVLKSGDIKILLYNNQAVNDVTEQLQKTAQAAGVTVVGVSETIPKGKNFQTWQLDQLSAILKAL